MRKIGLALGGGGARGVAHIPMLEVFDELGVELHAISGTSIGAVIGGLYASGMSGVEIREWLESLLIDRKDTLMEILNRKKVFRNLEFFDFSFQKSGLFKGRRFVEEMKRMMGVETFEELEIDLRVIAADYWETKQVILEKGDLYSAIRASMCLPGVFVPMEIDDRILVDGGGANPVPHDVLHDCDVVIAIDVMGFPSEQRPKTPGIFRSVFGMFDIMQNTIIEERLKTQPPNLYIKPNIQGVDLLDFHRTHDIYEMAEPAVRELEIWLTQLMDTWE